MRQFQVHDAWVNVRGRMAARRVPGEAAFFGEAEPLAALGAMVGGGGGGWGGATKSERGRRLAVVCCDRCAFSRQNGRNGPSAA